LRSRLVPDLRAVVHTVGEQFFARLRALSSPPRSEQFLSRRGIDTRRDGCLHWTRRTALLHSILQSRQSQVSMIRCYVTDRRQGDLLAHVARAVADRVDIIQVRE